MRSPIVIGCSADEWLTGWSRDCAVQMSFGVTPRAAAILMIAEYDGLSLIPEKTFDKVLMGRPDRWLTSAIVRF